MNIYTCTGFEGFYPVGTAAVVIAESQEQAADLLREALMQRYLPGKVKVEEFKLLNMTLPAAVILNDGNY